MDVNTQELEAAAAVLRQQFGNRLAGSLDDTQAQMRRALEQALGADEVASDRLVKQLTHTGRLVYHGGSDDAYDTTAGAASGDAPFVGPAGMLAGSQGPDMASPVTGMAVAPAAVNSSVSAMPTTGAGLAGVAPLGVARGSAEAAEGGAGVGGTFSAGQGNRMDAENREGATAGGQLADTNVAGPTSPSEQVVAGGDDDGQGYWQIT